MYGIVGVACPSHDLIGQDAWISGFAYSCRECVTARLER